MKTIAIIQARMGSTRLPGKVLMELCGQPMLYHIIERVKQVGQIDKILVATSENQEDDSINAYVESVGIECFRGSAENVLDRYWGAAQAVHAGQDDTIVRLTADNPLVDAGILSKLLTYFAQCGYPYALTSGFPLGSGGEVFSFYALKEAYENAVQPYEKEHVTPYMYREGRAVGKLTSRIDRSHFRFTVDTPEDFKFVEKVYHSLYHGTHDFSLDDIIELLEEKPEIIMINSHVRQKEARE